MAHDTAAPVVLNNDLFPGTFNALVTAVASGDIEISPTEFIPEDDDVYRLEAHELGDDRGAEYADGSDFLYLGNYIHPLYTVVSINGFELTSGCLYYAGSPDSFASPPTPGVIDRHSLEIMAEENIAALTGAVADDELTVIIQWEQAVSLNLTPTIDVEVDVTADVGLPAGGDPGEEMFFATPGTDSFTVPDGVESITVECWGAGGGGGGGVSQAVIDENYGGGGGGGGAYAIAIISTTPSANHPLFVGAGGVNGVGNTGVGTSGSNGESTFFEIAGGGSSIVEAEGGFGGGSGAAGLNNGGVGGDTTIGDSENNGGNGQDGYIDMSNGPVQGGAGGGGGGNQGLGQSGVGGIGGDSGNTDTNDGRGGDSTGTTGNIGDQPGGGGAGGGADSIAGYDGGSGGAGLIRVSWNRFADYTSYGDYEFIVPTGITEITVHCWGAGGGGMNADFSGSPYGGSGGGGGGYARSVWTVIPGNSYDIHVGLGGFSGLPATDGENSYITGPAGTNTGNGGTGGTASATPGLGGSGTGDVVFDGGNGGDGAILTDPSAGGGGGGSAGTTENGGNGQAASGGTPGAGGIGGNDGGTDGGDGGNVGAGNSGNIPGAGGGGGAYNGGTSSGASGTQGRVKITWY